MSKRKERGDSYPGPRRPAGDLGRLVFRVVNQLFGGRMGMAIESSQQREEQRVSPGSGQTPGTSTAEAAQVLEGALSKVESMLSKLEAPRPTPEQESETNMPQTATDLQRTLRELVQQLEGVLDHLGIEAQRLSDERSRLELVAERLEAGLQLLQQTTRHGEPAVADGATLEPAATGSEEPQFRPNGEKVDVVVAAMPGFQGLMDVQRGLASLAPVEAASVVSYRNGEASLEITLRSPLSVRRIVEQLRESTGHDLLIEEARPEELRLRLRFVD